MLASRRPDLRTLHHFSSLAPKSSARMQDILAVPEQGAVWQVVRMPTQVNRKVTKAVQQSVLQVAMVLVCPAGGSKSGYPQGSTHTHTSYDPLLRVHQTDLCLTLCISTCPLIAISFGSNWSAPVMQNPAMAPG